jgi:hypothetical protein
MTPEILQSGARLFAISAFFFVPHMAFAQNFQKCLDLGIPRQTCEDAILATSPDSEAGKEALRSAIERDIHKDDPNWERYKNGQW